MNADQSLRRHLVNLLGMKGAHVDFDSVVGRIPSEAYGRTCAGIPWSAWELLEHMRIAQWDILEFSRNPTHESPEWPAGYWPESVAPADASAWRAGVEFFKHDLGEMRRLVMDSERDLHEPFPWGDGQTLLREALLVADHNAYHLGQLVVLARALGVW
jgi:uncharacterized damage-inducible protein DinB